MNILPQANEVIIPIDKFTKYALNFDKDADKSIAFYQALGYSLNNAEDLIAQIRANIGNFPAKEKGDGGYGMKYEVVMEIKGANGKIAKVLTGWIDDAVTGEMRLTTAHID